MKRLGARNPIVLLMIAVMAGLAIASVVLGYQLTESRRLDVEAGTTRAQELIIQSGGLATAVGAQETAVDAYMLARSIDSAQRFEQAAAVATELVGSMRSTAADLPKVLASLTALDDATTAWQARIARPAIDATRIGDAAALELFTNASVSDHGVVDSALQVVMSETSQVGAGLAAERLAVNQTRADVTAFGLALLCVACLLGMGVIRGYGRAARRDAINAGVLSRFTEVTAFAADDIAVAQSNLDALTLLARPDAAVTHVLNRSKDRAVPQAVRGDAVADVLPLQALNSCAGMIRGSMYVAGDLSAPLTVHCPVYSAQVGTLACIPLRSDEAVGTVHLYWKRPNALPLEVRASIARVSEHTALAIGNRRLMAVLSGQANTDPRTGLANTRAFDIALEGALAGRQADEPLAILMLDLDHFKDFNDRHGHPAGDDALRVIAGVLRACMRDGDLAARYGGEEFTVLLPRVDADAARAVAERIRIRTESTIISLAPGVTDRITVSVGIAVAPAQGLDRVTLLHVADEALYRAKAAGRNQVACLAGSPDSPEAASADRSVAEAAGAAAGSGPQAAGRRGSPGHGRAGGALAEA